MYMYEKESSLSKGDFMGFPHLHVLINVPKNQLKSNELSYRCKIKKLLTKSYPCEPVRFRLTWNIQILSTVFHLTDFRNKSSPTWKVILEAGLSRNHPLRLCLTIDQDVFLGLLSQGQEATSKVSHLGKCLLIGDPSVLPHYHLWNYENRIKQEVTVTVPHHII